MKGRDHRQACHRVTAQGRHHDLIGETARAVPPAMLFDNIAAEAIT